jgi:crotonobetainyl-CoA:carnitine CoA-transferase CaiB-like acyl-CoA transferase
MESFSPGAIGAMGLDLDAIRARKPEIVIASSSLMGQTGPLAKLAGFGTMAGAISGFVHPTGWPDRAPCGLKAYTDYTSPRWLAASILAAMEHRRVTGRGQYIDFAQAEAAMHLLGPALLEQTVNGRTWERIGNRDLVHVPHGAFPTIGDDQWIAIACTSDDLWRVLAREMGEPHLSDLTREERHEREDELEELVAVWTSNHDGKALMESLQALSIPAHTVQNSQECAEDPQLRHRKHFIEVTHSTQPGGSTVIEGSRFVMSRTPATVSAGGPTFGEHTYEILSEVLGYDSEHIADLAAAEVLE